MPLNCGVFNVVMEDDMSMSEDRGVVRRIAARMSFDAWKGKLKAKRQTEQGHEIPDSTPEAPPVGWIKQPSMVDNLRALVRSELLRQEVEAAGAETFDEADDFDVVDDPEPISGYEHEADFEPPAVVAAKKAYEKAISDDAAAKAALNKATKGLGDARAASDPAKPEKAPVDDPGAAGAS